MKKVSKIFYFLLGLGIFSGIGVYAATTLLSKNVTFTSQDENCQIRLLLHGAVTMYIVQQQSLIKIHGHM